MKLSQVAIQLYTLRDHCQTTADYAATLKKVAAIGYRAIQISGVGPIPESDLLSIARGEGLAICATHEPADVIRTDPQRVVDRLARLDCKYTAYPFPHHVDFTNADHVHALVRDLDAAGRVLKANGQVLAYHNHADEFVRFQGRTALEYLYENTDPSFLQAELDTYWVQAGGGDPAAWCRKLQKRLPLLHLKDYAFSSGKPQMAEVGSGNLDFSTIIAAAEGSGCEWFIIEQDTCPGDPFESIKISFDYVRAHFVSEIGQSGQ